MTFHDFILYVVNDTMRVQNTRDRLCIHERNCERRDKKKGEWGNEGEKGGGVKQSETTKRGKEMEDNGGEERIDRRVDIIINEQTTGSPLNLFETPTM